MQLSNEETLRSVRCLHIAAVVCWSADVCLCVVYAQVALFHKDTGSRWSSCWKSCDGRSKSRSTWHGPGRRHRAGQQLVYVVHSCCVFFSSFYATHD